MDYPDYLLEILHDLRLKDGLISSGQGFDSQVSHCFSLDEFRDRANPALVKLGKPCKSKIF